MTHYSLHANQDLFRSLPSVTPDLPVPRIEITRHWHRETGFGKGERPMWSIKAIGLNAQQIPKEDEMVTSEEAEHIAAQWVALTGWPVVRLKKVVQTQVLYELETEE